MVNPILPPPLSLQEHQVHLKCLQSIIRTGASLLAGVREGAANRPNSDRSRSAKAKIEARQVIRIWSLGSRASVTV